MVAAVVLEVLGRHVLRCGELRVQCALQCLNVVAAGRDVPSWWQRLVARGGEKCGEPSTDFGVHGEGHKGAPVRHRMGLPTVASTAGVAIEGRGRLHRRAVYTAAPAPTRQANGQTRTAGDQGPRRRWH